MAPAFCFLYDYCYFRIAKACCMRFKPVLAAILLFCLSVAVSAVPAKRGVLRLAQPDGSVLKVRIIGDEYSHLVYTQDGSAIKIGGDGYYRYATLNASGLVEATEYVAGRPAPQSVISQSRSVPVRVVTKAGEKNRQRMMMKSRTRADSQEEDRSLKRVLVMPVQFQDLEFKYETSDMQNLLNNAKRYFDDQVAGKIDIVFVLAPVVTVSKGYAYYGEDDIDGLDKRPFEAVQEAVNLLDDQVDFSQVESLFMLYAGGNPSDGSADDDHIWPHRMSDLNISTQEKTFQSYATSSEQISSENTGRAIFTGIGPFCHEFGHEMGLKDMYDTDYEGSGGYSEGLWYTTSLMDGGCYNDNTNTPPCFNAIELDQLGIVEPEILSVGDVTLRPLSEQKRFLRMDTDTPGEYFLFECRAASGWDQYMGTRDGYSGSGLLIYHVDRSNNAAGYSQTHDRILSAAQRWTLNEVNNNPNYQCADLLEAYPMATSIAEIFFPNSNLDEFSATSLQPFKFRDGQPSPMSLLNIKKNGSSITFTVAGPIVLDVEDAHQDAFILNWHTDLDNFKNVPARLELVTPEDTLTYIVPPYESGKYSFTFEGLLPRTQYTFILSYDVDADVDTSLSSSFTTKAYNGFPFIYLNDTYRTITGYFTAASKMPLRVYNVPGVSSVSWTLDGQPISCGPDGYYHFLKGGLLKAVVHYEDGSREIITKQVNYK